MNQQREFCYVLRDVNGDYLRVSSKPFDGATKMADADYVAQSKAHNASKINIAAVEASIVAAWNASPKTRLDEFVISDQLAKLKGVKDTHPSVKALMGL